MRKPHLLRSFEIYGRHRYPGETISVAIGQGATTVTPVQLARAIGGLVMGGIWYRPHLLKSAKPELPHQLALNPDNVAKVISGMCGVVNEGGTDLHLRAGHVEPGPGELG